MPELLAQLKSLLGSAAQARRSGEPEEAEPLYKEAAAGAKAKDDVARAEALMGVAQARRDKGDRVFAAINYAEAITLLRSANALSQLAFALRHAADVRSELNEFAVADSHIEEAVRLYRALITTGEAAPLDLANALRISALIGEREGHASWLEACDIYTALSLTEGVTECNEHLERLKRPAASIQRTQETHA